MRLVLDWRSLDLTRETRGDEPLRWRTRELRGDKPGHKFHGNQFPGGGGDDTAPATVGSGNVVASGPKGRKELVASLRAHGYDGPVSYSVGKLQMIHDQHVGTAKVKEPDGGTTTVKVHEEVDAATSLKRGDEAFNRADESIDWESEGGAALTRYTNPTFEPSPYGDVNHVLITGGKHPDADAMIKMAQDHKLTEPVTLDRGMVGAHAKEIRDLKVGATIEYKNFMSTTAEQYNPTSKTHAGEDTARNFGTSLGETTVMRITAKKGTSFLPGTSYEHELILLPGKVRITHVSTGTDVRGNRYHIAHGEYEG